MTISSTARPCHPCCGLKSVRPSGQQQAGTPSSPCSREAREVCVFVANPSDSATAADGSPQTIVPRHATGCRRHRNAASSRFAGPRPARPFSLADTASRRHALSGQRPFEAGPRGREGGRGTSQAARAGPVTARCGSARRDGQQCAARGASGRRRRQGHSDSGSDAAHRLRGACAAGCCRPNKLALPKRYVVTGLVIIILVLLHHSIETQLLGHA
jgi:hypothetical protein